jgi:hypothetical protein
MILGLSIGMSIAGQSSQYVNYVPRYMIISIIVASGSSSLFLTWTSHTSKAAWVWKLGLSGLGQRLGWQQPFSISQIILPKKDLPVGTTLMSGCKLSEGAMFLSVSPSVFSSHLVSNIEAIGRDSDTTAVLAAGATNLASALPAALLPDVQEAYNHAVRHVFIVSVAFSCRAAITAAVVE